MTELAIPQPAEPVNLDLYAALVKQEEFIRATIKQWQDQLEEIQRGIQELMGDNEEAVFAGRRVFTWKYIDGINESEFKKAFPELHRAYTKVVEVEKLQRRLLEAGHPDVYRKFQTRQFKRVG